MKTSLKTEKHNKMNALVQLNFYKNFFFFLIIEKQLIQNFNNGMSFEKKKTCTPKVIPNFKTFRTT